MVELETRFEVQRHKLLVLGWFESAGGGRLVVDGPNGEREEVQIPTVDSSLLSEIQEALAEPPPAPASGPNAVMVRVNFLTDGARATRVLELTGGGTRLERLAGKLLGMAEVFVKADKLKKVIAALRARCP